MSNFVKCSFLVLMLFVGFLVNVNAKEVYYTNLNGVEMTKSEYDKMVQIYSERKATSLTQDEFDLVKNAEIVARERLYFKVVSDQNNVLQEIAVSEEEYNSQENLRSCDEQTREGDSGYFSTSYKTLTSSLLDVTTYYYLISELSWTIMPACRSYDIFAFRNTHMSYSNVSGTQTFFYGDYYTNISYNSNSLGYKGLSNGAGISMNLEDDEDITGLDLSLSAIMTISDTSYAYAHVFTTYQHAQDNLTRDQSMSYTLSAGGLGNVVFFNNYTIQGKYDNMQGIELIVPTT